MAKKHNPADARPDATLLKPDLPKALGSGDAVADPPAPALRPPATGAPEVAQVPIPAATTAATQVPAPPPLPATAELASSAPAVAGAAPAAGEQPTAAKTIEMRSSGHFPIVSVCASAGGLEAFEQFFRLMPSDSGMGFVVVQHLDPTHASLLCEILQRSTAIPVVEAKDQMVVQPNRVHVIPPNREMGIFHGALQLSTPSEPRGQRMPIDAFLRSLAEDQGESAAAIILSGTGTDGTLGIRAIHAAGGLCLAQEPATARYDGMPRSAIQAGYVSQVLPIENMPQALKTGMRQLPIRQAALQTSAAAVSGLKQILMLLRSGSGHDFSLYKKSTIARRVERRMAQHNLEDTADYVRYLKEHPIEVRALFRELLINVTSFFRDPEAFAVIKSEILPGLLADKPAGYTLRIWVAGCATGEEAYSIAMILRELMEETRQDFKVQIYSTDLDDEAITVARAGLYPANIAQDMTPERLRRFFVQEEGLYRVRKEVREMVVFAVHNLIKDPPFTKLDLVSCRNVMIYLESELQDRLLMALHYALKPGGALFLSPSESIGSHTELFETLQRKWKFYRARPTAASARALLTGSLSHWTTDTSLAGAPGSRPQSRETHAAELARRSLLQSFAPAAVLTDPQGNILYVHGEIGKYLRPAPGHPTLNAVEMARDGLQMALRESLRLAADKGLPTLNREIVLRVDGEAERLRLSVRLLPDPDPAHSLLLLSFEALPPEPQPVRAARKTRARAGDQPAGESRRIEELERELTYAQERVKAVLEERQAATEELKSGNEELQSTNEELQSTNEELETSKEELQSVNEELVTLNAELQIKVEEVTRVQDDMKNLLDNMRVGTIFLDRHLIIRRFTRDATRLYRLAPTDVGRPLADIRSELQGGDLLADAQAVLDTLAPLERELSTAGGTWYLARIQPYRTMDNVIDGVVLTFTDVTERVEAIAMRKTRDLAETVIDAVNDPLVVLDAGMRVVVANRAYHGLFGGVTDATLGQNFFAIGRRQWDLPTMHELLDEPLPDKAVRQLTLTQDLPGLGPRRLYLTARRIDGDRGMVLLTLATLPTVEPAPMPSPASPASPAPPAPAPTP